MKNKLVLSAAFIRGLFFTVSFLSGYMVYSQRQAPASLPAKSLGAEIPDDDPEIRMEWERQLTMDPVTRKVPEDIHKKELRYVRSLTSGLQRENPLRNLRTSRYAAAGTVKEGFVNRGPYNIGGRSRALAIDIKNEQHIIAGGASGGVWSSENQGRTWTRRSSLSTNPAITDIAQDTRNGHEQTWYYTTGEGKIGNTSRILGNGIFKSTDNGVTWAQLPATNYDNPENISSGEYFKSVQNIEIDPTTGDIYVASWNGILKSTDGATFTLVFGGGQKIGAYDVHVTANGVLYASLPGEDDDLTDDGIYRSTTGNSGSWTKISPGNFPTGFIRAVIASAPSKPNVLYFLVAVTNSTYHHDIWKYTYSSGNGSGSGGTWVDRTSNIPNFGSSNNRAFDSQWGYDLLVKVHPVNADTVFIGGISLYRSTDGFASAGNTTKIGGYGVENHHADQHALVFFNSNAGRALSGCDGGIFLTNDILAPDVRWTSLNNGYLTTQSYSVSIGANHTIMSGFQDQSTWFTALNDGQAAWTEIGSGDGCGNTFSKDGVFSYWSAQYNILNRCQLNQANDVLSYTPIAPIGACPEGNCNFVTTFALDPNNDDILYLPGYKTIWRNNNASTAGTEGWTEISNTQTVNQITAIGISTHPANVVYAGSKEGEIFRINNAHTGNPVGVNVSTGKDLPEGYVSCLAVDPRDAQRVLVVFSNYNIKSIFLTTDGGNTWSDVSGNLEQNSDGTGNGPSVRWLTMVGANAETYLVGTSTGVYSTNTLNGTQTTWTRVAEATIGHAVVTQIKSRDSDGLAVVGTHGNGLFSAHYEVSPAKIQAVKDPMEITVFSNASPTSIQTSELFTSTAPVTSPITMSVVSNSDNSKVTTSISNGTLTLSYTRNTTGHVTVVVRGTDANSNFINTTILVHVIAGRSEQTITFNPIQSRTYKDPVIYLRATSSSGLPITYSSSNTAIASVAGNVVTIRRAGRARITASQGGNDFYNPATAVQQNLDIGRLRQVITFPDIPAKPFGTADFSPGATTNSSAITYTSGNAEVATIVDGKIHITGVGTATITAQPGDPGSNYDWADDVEKTLTVTKGIQTITFPAIPTKPFGTADFAPGATTNSSSAITYSSANASVATIVDGKIHITGVGTSLITASAVADANYNAAADVQQTLRVTVAGKIVQTITFPEIAVKPYGTADFSPGATTNSSSAITYTSDNTAVATIIDGKIHITGVGTSLITASAVGDTNYNAAADITQTLTVIKAAQTITVNIPSLTVGGDSYTATPTGGASGNPVVLTGTSAKVSVSGFTITPISAGKAQISAAQSGNANYLEASVNVDFCVNPKRPIITKIAYNMLSSDEPAGNQWFLDNNPVAGATSQTLLTTQSGNYSVTTTIEGCVSLHSDALVYTGEVSKPQDELTIYPNPANAKLYVVLGGFDINSEATLSIYSLVGISFFNEAFIGSKILTISTSFLQTGAYIILVVQGDKRSSKLFFKQ